MKKYFSLIAIELQNTFAYRADTWLTAGFSIFSVVLAYLLWNEVFGNSKTINGFTLTQMITYYLLSGILSPLTQSDGLLHDFSNEIRNGSYSKYMVKPLSPLGYYVASSFARTLFPVLTSTIVLSVVMISFNRYFAAIRLINVLHALPVILIGASINILSGYIIAMATFKWTDVEFIIVLQSIIKSFLAGALIPLDLVFGHGLPVWSPFSYTLYYPVMLCMGKSDIPLHTAVCVLFLWIVIALAVSLALQKKAPKAFEGVGL